jgi:hypothetical protein
MTTMRLIDAVPTSVHPQAGSGWYFVFGEGMATEGSTGREVGAAYLLPGNPHYTRFKVIASPQPEGSDAPVIPAYQPINQRPLTAEEIAHFEVLAQAHQSRS